MRIIRCAAAQTLGGTITLTPYPETVNTDFVIGLAFRPCDLLDATENYQLFKVSKHVRSYLQVGGNSGLRGEGYRYASRD